MIRRVEGRLRLDFVGAEDIALDKAVIQVILDGSIVCTGNLYDSHTSNLNDEPTARVEYLLTDFKKVESMLAEDVTQIEAGPHGNLLS